jgi:molybdopterin-containing oxidoreductase family iron-sulfur binding subunit
MPPLTTDWSALRARLRSPAGPTAWRSLEDLVETPEVHAMLAREYPTALLEWEAGRLDRRRFLSLMGASLALAGLSACAPQPLETIVPYVRQPESLVPGKPLQYASAMVLGGYALPILVETHLGRPTKIEGNPEHPASRGASDALAQASVLELYDPDRSQVVTHLGEIRTWQSCVKQLVEAGKAQRAIGGAGLRILTETVTSPTLARQIAALLTEMPRARWHQYEPESCDSSRLGVHHAFGAWLETRYDLPLADVILTLDADLLGSGPGWIRHARDFARRRQLRAGALTATGRGASGMNRLYAIESMPTVTGTFADHRIPAPAGVVARFAIAVANELGLPGVERPALPAELLRAAHVIARDLRAHPSASLVVAGETQPPALHALVTAMNESLGNLGTTVITTDPVPARPENQLASIAELARDLAVGAVDVLVILGANPVYTAPADLDFKAALARAKLSVHLGLYADETAERCHWHVPRAHALESWSDARAEDGTVTIVQPQIAPLYQGKSDHEVLAALAGTPDLKGLELVRATTRGFLPAGTDFETFWRRALHDGFVAGTARPPRVLTLLPETAAGAAREILAAQPPTGDVLEVNLRIDPALHDGRFANLGWLQELPRPWTRLTWDNAALVAPATAEALGVRNEDVVRIRTVDGREVEAPIWVLPGHAERSLTLHLGYGRKKSGRVGQGVGVDAYPLRTTRHPWTLPGAAIMKTGAVHRLATTQTHHRMEGRALARSGTLADFRADPRFLASPSHGAEGEPGEGHGIGSGHGGNVGGGHPPSLFPGFPPGENAWGLIVDLGSCHGCNACVVACQAENNIPIVGKDEVLNGREMHWIRIDRYFTGELDRPEIEQQPVLCMHCEQAPCEVVCPVAATTHSPEGLNEMTYNRCVGTRYCANNCPYKVRRFNFYPYADQKTPVLDLLRNPDVTVRSRGVMEKCTYCVQRINQARIQAAKEERPIRDGEVVTACQQACPTQAIVFGNLADPSSEVARLRRDPLNYGLLTELGTRPRTSYLARIRNPNPELAAKSPA